MPDWKPHLRARLSSLRMAPERRADVIEELSQHLDERHAELGFQLADLGRQGGLADVAAPGGAAEVPFAGDGERISISFDLQPAG